MERNHAATHRERRIQAVDRREHVEDMFVDDSGTERFAEQEVIAIDTHIRKNLFGSVDKVALFGPAVLYWVLFQHRI